MSADGEFTRASTATDDGFFNGRLLDRWGGFRHDYGQAEQFDDVIYWDEDASGSDESFVVVEVGVLWPVEGSGDSTLFGWVGDTTKEHGTLQLEHL